MTRAESPDVRSQILVVLLGWGVLSLGSTQPWGYVPLIAGMTAYGITSFRRCDSGDPIGRALLLSLAGLCVAILVQLIPLPLALVRALSPATVRIADGLSWSTSADSGFYLSPLSVNPPATILGLAFVAALSVFFVGVARTLRNGNVHRIAAGLVWLGALVALIGITEQTSLWPGMYDTLGLPLPPDSTPLGPFASRNHYASWVLMSLSLTLGYVCGMVEDGLGSPGDSEQSVAHRSRAPRVVWAAFVTCAVAAMSLALVQTRSRAGILGLVAALTVIGSLLMRRLAATKMRFLITAPLLLLPLMAVTITGAQPIIDRFAAESWSTGHGRLPIWRQAIRIARDFPLTGAGFNTYQRVVPFYPAADLDQPYEGAHNDFLQLAIEGGLLVGIPALSTAAFFGRQTRQRLRDSTDDAMTRWLRIGAVTGLLLMVGQAMVDFGLQIPGNAVLFVLLAAVAIHREESSAYAQ